MAVFRFMAEQLLLLIFIYSEVTVQALDAPNLAVSSTIITETDHVTLSCEPPSYVSVERCYFYIDGTAALFPDPSCKQTQPGTQLLLIAKKSLPAEVDVSCFYTDNIRSPSTHSHKSSITINSVPAPGLTVSPRVITESDLVTLSCQTPSSAPDVQCYFSTAREINILSEASCQQSFTGTELLQRSQQSSPAEVAVTCYYAVQQGSVTSPWSDNSYITVEASTQPAKPGHTHINEGSAEKGGKGVPAPGLTVSPRVITESDSVTLSCQTPSSAPDVQCYFSTTGARYILTSTQPAKPGHTHINEGSAEKGGKGEKPEMSCQHFEGEHVVMICSLPGSAKPHTVCNFHVGEARSPVRTQTIRDKVSASNKWFCQFYVQIDDLLRDLRSVQPKVASCDYSLESEPNSVSARSDECSLTGIWEKESSRLQTIQTPTMSTAVMTEISTYTTPAGGFGEAATSVPALEGSSDNKITENFETVMTEISTYTTPDVVIQTEISPSTSPDVVIQTEISPSTTPGLPRHQPTTRSNSSAAAPGTPASKKETLKWVLVVAGCGVFAGIILLGSALMCIKRRRDDSMHTRALIHEGETPSAGNTALYSMISSVPGDVFPKGSVELKGHEAAYEDPDTYHMYCSITEEPAAAAQTHVVYSTVQLH
ncbi:uncharacterized protein LOC143005496 isoform X17 [Genypterus blacodes]|uniref:uncharacterized protein LOC143005496 isoform X17 n=1 Tax=Genypterus blacodes TaxID=154954 RepID=UPI003F75E91D